MDYSPPGSSVHGIFQTRILELTFPLLMDLPDPRIKPASPAWQVDCLPLSHLGIPSNTQWGQINQNIRVWSRIRFITRTKKGEQVGYSRSQRIRCLCFIPCTEYWVDMANLRGLQQPQPQPAILEHVLQNSRPVLHIGCTWESHSHEKSRKSWGQEENRELVAITTDLKAKCTPGNQHTRVV